jgi:hypothetical protein
MDCSNCVLTFTYTGVLPITYYAECLLRMEGGTNSSPYVWVRRVNSSPLTHISRLNISYNTKPLVLYPWPKPHPTFYTRPRLPTAHYRAAHRRLKFPKMTLKVPPTLGGNTIGPPSSMYLRGTPNKPSKTSKLKFPQNYFLRKSAWEPQIPPKHKSSPRDPIFSTLTCVPLLWPAQKNPNHWKTFQTLPKWPPFQPIIVVLY